MIQPVTFKKLMKATLLVMVNILIAKGAHAYGGFQSLLFTVPSLVLTLGYWSWHMASFFAEGTEHLHNPKSGMLTHRDVCIFMAVGAGVFILFTVLAFMANLKWLITLFAMFASFCLTSSIFFARKPK